MSGVINNSLVSDLLPYLEPAAQRLIQQILRGEVDVDPEPGINQQTKIEGLNDAQVRAVRDVVTAQVGREIDPNGLTNILVKRNYDLSEDFVQSTDELQAITTDILLADRNNRMAGPDDPSPTRLQDLAEGQPGWLRNLILDGIEENPLITLDPKLAGFINQVRENPDDFSPQILFDVVQGFITSGERERARASAMTEGVEERAREYLTTDAENREIATTVGTAGLTAGMQQAFASDRAEELEQDFLHQPFNTGVIEGGLIIPADKLRELWDDDLYINRDEAMQQFRLTAQQLDEYIKSPAGKRYFEQNPDELPISYTFDSSENKLFPSLDFGDKKLNYREAVELIDHFAVTPQHIRRLNEMFTAAGFYVNSVPLNMEDPQDDLFRATWREVLATSFLSNQTPLSVLNTMVNDERTRIEQIIGQFDDTALAQNVDSLAWSVLGRRLSSSEYEQIKSQISAFGDIEPLLGSSGAVADEVARFEQPLQQADSIKLQRALQRTFEPEFSRRKQFMDSRSQTDQLRDWFRGRTTDIDALPDIVLEQGENA